MSVHEKMTAIANRIRQFGGGDGGNLLNLDQIADGVEQVYDNGYYTGNKAGQDQGKQEQYDLFWGAFQKNGTRTNYMRSLTGDNFSVHTFYPKYDIVMSGYCPNAFSYWDSKSGGNLDLATRLEECGVTLDTSEATNLDQMFIYSTTITRVPPIDVSAITGSNHMFSNTYGGLKKIDLIRTAPSVTYTNWFYNAMVEEVYFDGEIGQNIDFSTCPLKKESIRNIVEHLSDSSTGKTITFKTSAVNAAFTTDEWNALKAKRTNWTFALA